MLSCFTRAGIEKLFTLRCVALVCLVLLPSQVIHPWQGVVNPDRPIPNDLKLGETLSRDIGAGKTDSFKISVPAKQYFLITVEQQGVVLEAELFLGDRSVVKLETVNGAHGPLYFSAIANEAADYKLNVTSAESWASGGRYTVKLETVRDIESADEARISAQAAFAEGQALLSRAREQSGEEANKSRNAAIEKLNAAAKQWRDLTDYHGETISLYMIGVTYQRASGKSSDAKQVFLQALTLAPKLLPNDWRLEASLWNDLGVVYDSLYDEKNAHAALKNALRIYEAHHDQRGVASANNNFGLAYARSGQAREAIKAFEIALPIRRADRDKSNEYNTLNNLGGAYETLGEPRQALDYYTQALNGWKAINDARIPIGLNNVARASDTLGSWKTAVAYYQQALELAQKQGSRRIEATFLYNIGDLYSRLNDPTRALNNYQAALRIQQELKNPRDEANVLAHIAQIYLSLGQTDQALENYNRAIQILESNKDAIEIRRVYAYTLIGLATAYLNTNPTKTIEYCERARSISQLAGDLQEEAEATEKLGQAYAALGQRAKALESFNSALLLRRDLEDRLGEASTLFQLATLKSNSAELNDADKLGEDVLKIVESLRGNLVSPQLRTSYFEKTQRYYEQVIDVKMRLYEQHHNEAHRASALAVSERKRARVLIDSLIEANADIRRGVRPALLAESRENEENLTIKSRLREQLLNEIKVNEKLLERSNTPPQLRRVNELKSKLASVSKDIGNLSNQYDDIQTRIRSSSPSYAALNNPATVNAKELQDLLSADTVLLQYSLGETRSYVWVVTNGEIQSAEVPARGAIEGAVQKLVAAFTARSATDLNENPAQRDVRNREADAAYADASARLSQLLLGPVASQLNNKKRLIIVADGPLQLIPFAALPDPNATPDADVSEPRTQVATLLKDHEIVNLPSASVLALQRRELAGRKAAPLSLVVVADPVFDSDDERIQEFTTKGTRSKEKIAKGPSTNQPSAAANPPSVKTDDAPLRDALKDVGLDPNRLGRLRMSRFEAQDIAGADRSNQSFIALGFQANRSLVTSGKLSNYRYVHFATHGVLDLEHPELSGIVLSRFDEKGRALDGYLRLYEIYNLNLPAELVVLSACQTGTGKQIRGEGLITLTRGFMYAGAARVVASLWNVDDTATAELMKRFYQEMFLNRKRPSAALRDAQLSIANQKRWNAPYFWAGFVLQGEWR